MAEEDWKDGLTAPAKDDRPQTDDVLNTKGISFEQMHLKVRVKFVLAWDRGKESFFSFFSWFFGMVIRCGSSVVAHNK
jgi:hypothetical protein